MLLMLSVNVDGCVVHVHVHCIYCICCRYRSVLQLSLLIYLCCCCCMRMFQLCQACMSIASPRYTPQKHQSPLYNCYHYFLINLEIKHGKFSFFQQQKELQMLCLPRFHDARTFNAHYWIGGPKGTMDGDIFHW